MKGQALWESQRLAISRALPGCQILVSLLSPAVFCLNHALVSSSDTLLPPELY